MGNDTGKRCEMLLEHAVIMLLEQQLVDLGTQKCHFQLPKMVSPTIVCLAQMTGILSDKQSPRQGVDLATTNATHT